MSRTVRILETFDQGTRDLSLTQITHRAGMSGSSAYRLVGEMAALGLLEKLPNRRYRIGLRLWELANRTPGALGLREVAMPHLQDVQAIIRQHTQLGILRGDQVLYLERLSSHEPVINITVVGGTLPLHATSSGLILLAHSDPETVDRILGSQLSDFAMAPRPSPNAMRKILAEVRRDGYALTKGYIHRDASAVAVPIMGPFGGAVASLSVVVPTEGIMLESLLNVLRPAAQKIAIGMRSAYFGETS
ncbi:IclR family transcriptional regulator [Paenarthrobacter sp. A20]|uniref:IclR family transcriptional regulator n=1 Tax=Paenarthrobacter sp. A20 TaxID=2817891 RepID=UPI0020A1DD2A|nr:IclR family transcriptional regulator [Paenarthrobacter sp. A20]MCP1415747.1 DNA-binding IclR family transcriptional regulator [Paenarthrobacter sp. A20]